MIPDREKDPSRGAARPGLGLVALLAALTAIGPFSLQILAPALPVVAADLAVTPAAAQLMLSLSLGAMAVATLIWGPLSDRLGRRPVVIGAMWLASVGAVIVLFAPSLELAVTGRLLQAGGAVAGMVLGRAIAQDLYGRGGAAAVLGKITAAMAVAPMLAPAISGLLVAEIGWRAIFVLGALLAGGLALAARARLPETAPAAIPEPPLRIFLAFREIAVLPGFWAYAGFGVASLSTFLFFVGAAPYVMGAAYGIGPQVYGLWFMLVALSYMAANMLCGPVSARLGGDRALRWGAYLSLAGTAGGLLLAQGAVHHPLALIGPVMVQSVGAGISVPNALAGAVAAVPDRAGAASGLMGFCQFLIAGCAAQIAGLLPHDSAGPMMLGMLLMLGAGTLSHLLLAQRARRRLRGGS